MIASPKDQLKKIYLPYDATLAGGTILSDVYEKPCCVKGAAKAILGVYLCTLCVKVVEQGA